AANNCALTLLNYQRFEETKSLLRPVIPVARRVLRDDQVTLRMRSIYAMALYSDAGATLDDLNEAVTTLEEMEPTARRVLGGTHPLTTGIERALRRARAALKARKE
ncbi:unnamed protein product, partial [Pelagomonas calceolata]